MSDEISLALYRITQEALNNVRKHSEATQATVALTYTPLKVSLSISDNGKGFKLPEKQEFDSHLGLGLIGMRERAQLVGANLTIESIPGHGTTVQVEV